MKIDAEVFFWKDEKLIGKPIVRTNKSLQQAFLPEQIAQTLQRNGIDGCIGCVAEPAEVETRFLSELAITHPIIRGVIGWLDLFSVNAPEKIREFQQYAPIRGYCLDLQNEKIPGAETMNLIGDSSYSLDISLGKKKEPDYWNSFLSAYPAQSFILQNAGNPDFRKDQLQEWKGILNELAKHPNLSCKLSGFLNSGIDSKSWKPADFYPFLEVIFDAFGPDRVLYTSDWPLLLVSGIYVQWKSLLEKFMENSSPENQEKFFGGNAARVYRI